MIYYQVILAEAAIADLDAIFDYIYVESDNLLIAESFVTNLFSALNQSLGVSPYKHPIYKNQIRKFVFPKYTSYTAYFRIDESANAIYVLAITHTAQFNRYDSLK